MKHPRVLFVGAFPPHDRKVFGGMVTACETLLNSSLPERIDFDLIDSTQISNPPPVFLVRLWYAVRRFFIFASRLERQRPDVIILFAAAGASIAEKGSMAWYARVRGVPSLIFPRGGIVITQCNESRFSRFWIRIALGGARKLLCQGPAWQKFAVDVLGFNIADAPIIPNWTATNNLLEIGKHRTYNEAKGSVQLLFLAWLERDKGIFELLQACKQLPPESNFILNIAGKGHAEASVKEFVDANGLGDRVRFLGWIHGSELEAAFAEADIFVLPSWREGLPNAMIEAMACGLAVVITSVGNIPDFLTNEQEALLITPQNVGALTEALARVISDPELRQSLASSGHLFAAKTFAVEPAMVLLEKAVLSVMNDSGISKKDRLD